MPGQGETDLLSSLQAAHRVVIHYLREPPDNRFGTGLTDLATFLFC